MLAPVTRDGTICAKNSTFAYFDRSNSIAEKDTQSRSPTPIMTSGDIKEPQISGRRA